VEIMAARFDRETIERFRRLPPARVLEEVERVLHAAGPSGSEDFLDVYEQLVEEEILTWELVRGHGR
jgi:hypothetical protein